MQAGFTPMEAIQAATLVPARVMKLDKELGTVEAGKRADLIVIDGDPLADIRNTRNVELVVAGGKMYNSAELWKEAGLQQVRTCQITVQRRFDSFEDHWNSAANSNTLRPMFEAMSADRRQLLKTNVRQRLQTGDGPLTLSARANAVCGIKP